MSSNFSCAAQMEANKSEPEEGDRKAEIASN